MRSLVFFIFASLTAVLLSSCGGSVGGDGGVRPTTATPRTPSPSPSPTPVNVGVSFEADVHGATLEATTDTINQRAKDSSERAVGTHVGVVVTDDSVLSSRVSSGADGLAGFALPKGGCKVIEKGFYTQYLTSYRQGGDKLKCVKSCSDGGVVTAAKVRGYKILLCVQSAELSRQRLEIRATDCKGGKVLQFDARGCQTSGACTTSGYKVRRNTCVAKVPRDCRRGEQGFHAGKCVANPQDATHCQAVGKVLQFDTQGCEQARACKIEGYKIRRNACVAKVARDCRRGKQGFHAGKCVANPQDATHCQAAKKVLQFDTQGCEQARACETSGYKVKRHACVAKVGKDCRRGKQGFHAGKCVANPQDATHCQAVKKVLQFDTEGCQRARACRRSGYKVKSGACVAKVPKDCRRGKQGFHAGKCVANPQDATHCQAAKKVLQFDTEGCQRARACRRSGYKVKSGACVASVADSDTDTPEVATLLSPEAVDASFDEAFQDKPTSPVDFCIIGSGTIANNMARVSNTITDNKACQHQTINSPRDARRAFASNKVTKGTLVAFTSSSVAFASKGLNAKRLRGYKAFIPVGDNGYGDFLDDPTYTAKTKSRIRAALLGGDTFAVGRLNAQGDARHATSNGCGKITNCVLANGSFTVNGSVFEGTAAATAYVAASIARAMAYVPSALGVAYVNTLFDKAKVEHNGISIFNPLRLIDAVREILAPQDLSEEDFESASIDTDDIYRALMRAQYAAVGQVGIPTHMDDIRIDVTEFDETRAFTMPATSYRYRSLPPPTHSPLFGMLGMVYREDARYPEVGIAFNDKQGRTFMSASHYRSEDFFGAYGSGGFRFNHVDNYRVVGKHAVVAGLDVTLWGRCGLVREGGVLLDWQRGCDSGAGVSYAHGFMGGEMTWRAEGARFLGGSLSSSGRRYDIAGGATQGEASVQLRFNW